MIRNLLYTIFFTFSAMNINAQSIGIIGVFNNWSSDAVMNTADNITYTLQNFTLLADGELKFRQDGAWTENWGAPDFPSGVATQGGANILGLAGTYDVTFNRISGAYSFVAISNNFDVIGFNGGFNNFGATVPMATADGITYKIIDYHFDGNGVNFVKDTPSTTVWGGIGFPSGNATVDGPTIPLTAGFYNLDFNKITLAYNFVSVPVSIIGDAAIDFATDIDMTTTDGINFTLNNQGLIGGKSLKFRANSSWDTNWGGTAFPTGTAISSDLNEIIVDITGTYDITFNRLSGAYAFTLITNTFPIISISGTVMQTTDGVNYTLVNQSFTSPNLVQFKDPINSTTFWGATAFPTGTAIFGSADAISVPAGFYNVTFNRTTGAYSFLNTNNVSIGLIGSFNGWSGDVVLETTDNINYALQNFILAETGELKFRQDGAWTNNWGAADFPIGIARQGGANILGLAGTYNVFFNRLTGDYVFTLITGVYPVVSNNGMVMQTTNGVVYTSLNQSFDTVTQVQFNDPTNPNTVWGATAFPSGTAIAGSSDKIDVPPGFFNLTFNRTTGAYSFAVVPISIIGPGLSDWNTDVTMDSADYGFNSSKMNVVFVGGDIKFRANADATISWGGSTTFPTGTATTSGAGNIAVSAGTYSVSFNRVTGVYSFSVLSTTNFDKAGLVLYPNPTTTTFAINGAFEKVQVYAITGQLVKTFTKTIANQNFNIADLKSGVYFVKAVDASNIEKTSKLIKQ